MSAITNLAAALVKAQAAMGGAKKDSNNPFFKSKYADLASVDAAISGPAAENGLAYVQISHERDNAAAVETVIVHSSGETLSCGIVSVPVAKHDAQGYGSALTYCRRYSLAAAFGVCPEDDDGNAAAKAAPKKPEAKADTKPHEAQAKSMPKNEFVDHCTAISEAVDQGKDALVAAANAAADAAEKYGDKDALLSLKTKYDQARAMLKGKDASGLAPTDKQPE